MARADPEKAKEIGGRVYQARKEAGMTQRELGDLLGVTDRSIAAYETGEVVPYRLLRELESATGRSAAWFLHGDGVNITADDRLVEMVEAMRELRKDVRKACHMIEKCHDAIAAKLEEERA